MRQALFALLVVTALSSGNASAAPAKKKTFSATREFKALIRKQHRDFDRCPQAEVLRTKKRVKGIVLVKYAVNGDGKLTDSGIVHNTTKSKAIADCVLRALETVKFPATFGPPIVTTHAFKFNVKK